MVVSLAHRELLSVSVCLSVCVCVCVCLSLSVSAGGWVGGLVGVCAFVWCMWVWEEGGAG